MQSLYKPTIVSWIVLSGSLLSSPAFAQAGLEARLREFQENPRKAMNALPKKSSQSQTKSISKFSSSEIANGEFVTAKNRQRDMHAGRAATQSNDLPEKLVDNPSSMVTAIDQMDGKLVRGEVKVQPWSDYYWALYNGQLAYRYSDSSFPSDSDNWKLKADYVLKNAVNFSSIDNLSPAEKYDLLVGDTGKSLTHSALGQGETYFRAKGSVETWMGICHGWAPAAYMMERPKNAAKVLAADGKTWINFYPADVKALASLLWANSPGNSTRFIGGRCNLKNPKTNSVGRVTDQGCFDTNPGAWHQAIVNQIGVNKRSFVMDATFDYEVWNQPVRSYSYTYFNPQTLKPVKTLKEATAPMKEFTNDKFKEFRSSKAAYVVGISMDVDYIAETNPSNAISDMASNDAITQVSYEYDLELDANMNILGGEWHTNAHPDFLWTPAPDSRAKTPADTMLARDGSDKKTWDGKSAMPREWSDGAVRAGNQGTPLATIVEALIKISNSSFRL